MMNGSAPMMNGGAPMMNGSRMNGAPTNGAAFTPQPMALGVARPDAAHAISSMGRLAMAPPPARAPSAPAFAAFGLPPSAVPLSRAAAAAGVVLVAADETQHPPAVRREYLEHVQL